MAVPSWASDCMVKTVPKRYRHVSRLTWDNNAFQEFDSNAFRHSNGPVVRTVPTSAFVLQCES
jgi:hypothetical protein